MNLLAVDTRSVSFLMTLSSILISLLLLLIWRTRKNYPGFGYWTLSIVFLAIGNTFLMLRGIVSDFLSIILANLFLFLTNWLTLEGTLKFRSKRAYPAVGFGLTVLLVALASFFTYFRYDTNARISVFSLISCIPLAWNFIVIVRKPPKKGKSIYHLFGTLTAILFLTMLVRGLIAPFQAEITDAMGTAPVMWVVLAVDNLLINLWAFCFILLNIERLESEREHLIADLQAANERVKTFGEMLPICSSCKKIRNDEGYWMQIESYIREHSDTEFTHSLCPDCAKKYLDA